jgi:hypothetical protein
MEGPYLQDLGYIFTIIQKFAQKSTQSFPGPRLGVGEVNVGPQEFEPGWIFRVS